MIKVPQQSMTSYDKITNEGQHRFNHWSITVYTGLSLAIRHNLLRDFNHPFQWQLTRSL